MTDQMSSICVETASGKQLTPHFNGEIVCLNITESRTRNIIAELGRRGFSAVEFNTARFSTVVGKLLTFAKAARRTDFVLCGGPIRSQILWMLVAKALGRPCVLDFPMDFMEWPFPVVWHCRWTVLLTARLADYVLTLRSRAYLIDKLGLDPRRVLFLENCPDRRRIESSHGASSRFQPRPGSFVICCSGCHSPHRLERFMPTFEALLDMAPNVELLLIGDPEKPSIVESQRYARAGGFEERVHLLPLIRPVEDFFATLARCQMWVATMGDDTIQGRHELRMELLEVGILGKPVVAARIPGLIDNDLADERELIFIDPSNPVANARKLAGLIRDPKSLGAIGERLRTCVLKRFSLDDDVDHLLEELSSSRGA